MSMDKSEKAQEYPVDAASPHLELENRITAFSKDRELDFNGNEIDTQAAILELPPEKKVVTVRLLLARMAWAIHQIRDKKSDAYFLDCFSALQKQKQLFGVLL